MQPGSGSAMIDMIYALDGTSLPAVHAGALADAVGACLPWLAAEPSASIHPLRTSPTAGGDVLLARRARLAIRMPEARVADAHALEGRVLDVAGRRLVVGAGAPRSLTASPTLYAARVASETLDDAAFHDEIGAWLAGLPVRCEHIAGRFRRFATGSRELTVRGLALHGLAAADSVDLQRRGYGPHGLLGCGIFVPHKAIAVAA